LLEVEGLLEVERLLEVEKCKRNVVEVMSNVVGCGGVIWALA
jgi:hypothetical protein